MSPAHRDWSREAAGAILAGVEEPGPVLVALQALQEEFGYVHPDAIQLVADTFNVSRADVYGVMTFYTDLRSAPPADVEIRVCMGEACQSVGARTLLAAVQATAPVGAEVSRVFCMGNCALGPTAVVDGRLLGRASIDSVHAASRGAGA